MTLWREWTSREAAPSEARDSGFLRFEDVFSSTPNTSAGVQVDQSSAMTLPAVYRCVSLNAETIASLPTDCLARREDRREPYSAPFWLSQPNPEYTWPEMVQEVQTGLEIDGNAFILKVSTEGGRLVELWHLAPKAVTVRRMSEVRGRPLVYDIDANGEKLTVGANAMLHIKAFTLPRQLRGISPIAYHAELIGSGLAAQKFANNFFGTGAVLSGLIEHPAKQLNQEQTDRLKADFTKRHGGVTKSHAIGVLTGGATWKQLSVTPEESQFLLTQRYTAEQVAYLFGIPPHYVTPSEGAKGYVTGVLAGKEMWMQTGLGVRIVRLERAFSSLLPRPAYIKFNLNAFLRPDPQERATYLGAMFDRGIINADRWRELEDMNPRPGGTRYYINGGTFALDEEGVPIPPQAAPPPQGETEPTKQPA